MTGVFVIWQCNKRAAGAMIHRSVWIKQWAPAGYTQLQYNEGLDAVLILLPEPLQNKEGL
jgi:hypothetical protein